MAGLGGSLGYAMGGIDWGTLGNKYFVQYLQDYFIQIFLGTLFGGHVRFVFTIVLFIFIFCVMTTITSFNEIPLDILANPFKVRILVFVICCNKIIGNLLITNPVVASSYFHYYCPLTELYLQRKSVSAQGGNGVGGGGEVETNTQSDNKQDQQYLQTNETSFSQAVSLY